MRRRLRAMPKPEWSAKVVEWNTEKGCGWLQWADKRVFLRRREYSGPSREPEVGEEVHFILGLDNQGRPCAMNAVSAHGGGHGTGFLSWILLCALLGLPAIALQRLPIEFWKTATYALAVSLITYAAYASDKRRARTRAWRIPEAHLHLLELLGGWPGAWLAQRDLRHKCSKRSYQFIFLLIILIHQFAAYDSLQDWRLSRALIKHIAGTSISTRSNDFSHRLLDARRD